MMKEIVIENPTRIVNLNKAEPDCYVYGLYASVETPEGNFIAIWEHGINYGCVCLRKNNSRTLSLCRNSVLIGSLAKYFLETDSDDRGIDIPVLMPKDAESALKRFNIPDDGYAAFNKLLRG